MSNKENGTGGEGYKKPQQFKTIVNEEMAGIMHEVAAWKKFAGMKVEVLAKPGDKYEVPYGSACNRGNQAKVPEGMQRVAVTDTCGNNRLGNFQREVANKLQRRDSSGDK